MNTTMRIIERCPLVEGWAYVVEEDTGKHRVLVREDELGGLSGIVLPVPEGGKEGEESRRILWDAFYAVLSELRL